MLFRSVSQSRYQETEEGEKVWKEKTGTDWPYSGWWGRPESIDPEIFYIPLNQWVYKKYLEAVSDPVLADKCVPECLYRGFCPEFMNPCGYSKTKEFEEDLQKYRNTDYEQE